MKTNNNNYQVRETNSLFVILLFVCVFIYSFASQAQSTKEESNNGEIAHVSGVNMTAKAEALNASVNSSYEDLKPALTPCGKKLYFSRAFHPYNTAGVEDKEDIWFTEFNQTANTWSEPERLGGDLNNAGPNFINSVSVTGDTIILGNQYMKNGKMKAGLSYSVHMGSQWTAPMPINIKNYYSMSNSANSYVSLKTGVIISSIQTVESMGENDLYVSFWDGKQATEPVNMGAIINTEMDESSPFLASDNKTLYFASKGHSGYGGYDIWVTKRLDDTWTNWSQPENLGPAVNGSLDDEFFTITHCGQYAVFSKRVNIHNTDLYRISLSELFNSNAKPEITEIKKSSAVASL